MGEDGVLGTKLRNQLTGFRQIGTSSAVVSLILFVLVLLLADVDL